MEYDKNNGFKKIEDELSQQETAIINQKNILSKEEYSEKIALLIGYKGFHFNYIYPIINY